VKPWVESLKAIQAPAGAAENKRTVLSVAPAGACGFCRTKPTVSPWATICRASGAERGKFAKRQLTWFRRQLDPEWIRLKPEEALEKCVKKFDRRGAETPRQITAVESADRSGLGFGDCC
jgi:hypothetical protein